MPIGRRHHHRWRRAERFDANGLTRISGSACVESTKRSGAWDSWECASWTRMCVIADSTHPHWPRTAIDRPIASVRNDGPGTSTPPDRGPHGHLPRPLRRVRCAQEDRRRLRPTRLARRRGRVADPHLRHHDRRPPRARRLAQGAGRPSCRHGVDRGLLEADLAHPRGVVRADPGQRRATSSRPRAARPTSRTPSGSPSSISTACSGPASSRPSRSASSAT